MATKRITFYNPETDVSVEVTVSMEDAIRAETDIQFATALMNAALQESPAMTQQLQASAESIEDSVKISRNDNFSESGMQQEDSVNSEDTGLYRWTTEIVLLLLDTYAEREKKFSSGKYSQRKIWEEIANVMKPRIPSISGPQCAAKMRSLKKTYKSVKDHNNKSGNDRRTWQFYEKMDTIFQAKAWCSPVAVASSSGVSTQRSDTSDSEISSERSGSLPKKETVVSLLRKRLRQKAEEEEARAKRHRERVQMDEKMLDLLTKLIDKN